MDGIQDHGGGVPIGRRERNKLRIRNRLYTSALRLFAEKGYEQTSVDEIAESADVARGTFFNYFQRKEDLISAWGENRRDRLRAGLEVSDTGEAESLRVSLGRCMRTLADINEEEKDLTRPMLAAWVKAGRPLDEDPYAADIFASIVTKAKDNGEIPESVNHIRVGNLLRDAYFGTLYRWSQSKDDGLKLHNELQEVCEILLDGILREASASSV
jgi:AcrR family transcriptional regulator